MAITDRGAALTETHRLLQARIGAETAVKTMSVWKTLDPVKLDATTAPWLAQMIAVVTGQRSKSSAASALYLQAFRIAEIGSTFVPVLAAPVGLIQLVTSLKVTGPISMKAAMARGASLTEATDNAVANVAGAAMRHSLDGGRETMIATVATDPKAYGWARATSGKPCSFCAMLASRGPVYGEQSVQFRSHDHCACSGEPVFSRDAAWPAGSERYREIWDESTAGLSGTEARSAFEKALDTPPAVRHSTAKVTDPGVLAEATRRNVSPARVVELREEKASRRFLEDRARREAAKNLTADSADVIAAAKRAGVHPDDVLTARHRVADVRAVAREEAARTQAAAIRELDRLDAVHLKAPPRKTATSGTGRKIRGGEYDFLEQLSDREKARLSKQWYGGSLAPDQIAANMSNALGRDLSVDEAMDMWLDLNRRSDAAGALRRGKIPTLDGYSGQIDPADLIPQLSDEGYDITTLFGDDLDAAAHIAQVDANLVRDDALNYLGDAANAADGTRPYQMGFQSWEEEVRTLEDAKRTTSARYAELVPQYLDEPGLDFEHLYARIISTARKAGEEVPGYATIPWS